MLLIYRCLRSASCFQPSVSRPSAFRDPTGITVQTLFGAGADRVLPPSRSALVSPESHSDQDVAFAGSLLDVAVFPSAAVSWQCLLPPKVNLLWAAQERACPRQSHIPVNACRLTAQPFIPSVSSLKTSLFNSAHCVFSSPTLGGTVLNTFWYCD